VRGCVAAGAGPETAMDVRRWHLQTQISIILVVLTLTAVGVLGVMLDRIATNALSASIGRQLRDVAAQMRDKLDRSMFERFSDIRVIARGDRLLAPGMTDAERRATLEVLQSTYPDYAWIGLADPEGRVAVSTGGLLEGADVSERPWYRGGRDGPFVGDVHQALLLAKLLENPDPGAPLRFVDVAMPVLDADGRLAGVLGAHLSWKWASEVKESVLAADAAYADTDVLVLDRTGVVLLGPSDLEGHQLNLASVARAATEVGYAVETWPDGRRYLTGFSASMGYRDYPGLGWIVLSRQPAEIALAPVDHLQRLFTIGALTIAVIVCLLGLWLAARVARSMRRLAAAAGAIGEDSRIDDIPVHGGFAEIRELGEALRGMLERLWQKQAALAEANATLESRVVERTAELSRTNEALSAEIAERRRVEAEREGLIVKLKEMAETDFLTGVLNRRSFYSIAGRELAAARRYVRRLAVIMLDIDHFKAVNDRYGHLAGDQVLREIAALCREEVRDSDAVGRYGGEEFVLLISEADDHTAPAVAERLRRRFEERRIELADGTVITVTASFGVAVANSAIEDTDQLVRRADEALYRAKESGRNRVCLA